MDVDIKLAESLIEAFNHEETGILLWDKNDRLLPQVNGSRIWTQEELECII